MPANTRSTFPADAQAVIYKVAPSVMTSAPRKEEWKLKFERRTPLRIEPLMGWTEDDDPLALLELLFPLSSGGDRLRSRTGVAVHASGSSSM